MNDNNIAAGHDDPTGWDQALVVLTGQLAARDRERAMARCGACSTGSRPNGSRCSNARSRAAQAGGCG